MMQLFGWLCVTLHERDGQACILNPKGSVRVKPHAYACAY